MAHPSPMPHPPNTPGKHRMDRDSEHHKALGRNRVQSTFLQTKEEIRSITKRWDEIAFKVPSYKRKNGVARLEGVGFVVDVGDFRHFLKVYLNE